MLVIVSFVQEELKIVANGSSSKELGIFESGIQIDFWGIRHAF